MLEPIDEPLLTRVVPSVEAFRPEGDAIYVSGSSGEERADHTDLWTDAPPDLRRVHVRDIARDTAVFESLESSVSVNLRDRDGVSRVWAGSESVLYLDITGLPHHVWVPLLRAMWEDQRRAFVVYVEPGDYRPNAMPTPAKPFDLSERIEGIAPLPGFASLARRGTEFVLVPLLGFEGARFRHLLENTQPGDRSIVPLVGVPGFRLEYPFHTYHGNRAELSDTGAWREVRFAVANCPFSAYAALEDVRHRRPEPYVRVGMIGTKPHSVGAVLFALAHPQEVELVHDHPVRKSTRTSGTSRLCLYDIGTFRSRKQP